MSKNTRLTLEKETPINTDLKLSTNPNTLTNSQNTKINAHLNIKVGPDVPIAHGSEIDSGITTDAPSTAPPSCLIL